LIEINKKLILIALWQKSIYRKSILSFIFWQRCSFEKAKQTLCSKFAALLFPV
jgi:hypothetical protein